MRYSKPKITRVTDATFTIKSPKIFPPSEMGGGPLQTTGPAYQSEE